MEGWKAGWEDFVSSVTFCEMGFYPNPNRFNAKDAEARRVGFNTTKLRAFARSAFKRIGSAGLFP